MFEQQVPFIVDFGTKNLKFGFSNTKDFSKEKRINLDIEEEFVRIFQNIHPEDHSLLLTGNLKEEEDIVQILFEAFNLPSLCIKEPSILSLFNYGKVDGNVLELGHEFSYLSKIKEGVLIDKSDLYYTGSLFDKLLSQSLNLLELENVSKIKEKLFYISKDYQKDLDLMKEDQYIHSRNEYLSDKVINVSTQRFLIPVNYQN